MVPSAQRAALVSCLGNYTCQSCVSSKPRRSLYQLASSCVRLYLAGNPKPSAYSLCISTDRERWGLEHTLGKGEGTGRKKRKRKETYGGRGGMHRQTQGRIDKVAKLGAERKSRVAIKEKTRIPYAATCVAAPSTHPRWAGPPSRRPPLRPPSLDPSRTTPHPVVA